jgi:hypothetical protein
MHLSEEKMPTTIAVTPSSDSLTGFSGAGITSDTDFGCNGIPTGRFDDPAPSCLCPEASGIRGWPLAGLGH